MMLMPVGAMAQDPGDLVLGSEAVKTGDITLTYGDGSWKYTIGNNFPNAFSGTITQASKDSYIGNITINSGAEAPITLNNVNVIGQLHTNTDDATITLNIEGPCRFSNTSKTGAYAVYNTGNLVIDATATGASLTAATTGVDAEKSYAIYNSAAGSKAYNLTLSGTINAIGKGKKGTGIKNGTGSTLTIGENSTIKAQGTFEGYGGSGTVTGGAFITWTYENTTNALQFIVNKMDGTEYTTIDIINVNKSFATTVTADENYTVYLNRSDDKTQQVGTSSSSSDEELFSVEKGSSYEYMKDRPDLGWSVAGKVLTISSNEGMTASEINWILRGRDLYGQYITKAIMGSATTVVWLSAFEECSALTEITFNSSITEIKGNAFKNCTALENITIPANVTTIGKNAFSGSGLKTVTFEGDVPPTLASNTFENTNALTTINVPAGKAEAYKTALGSALADKVKAPTIPTSGTDWSLDLSTGALTITSDDGIENWAENGYDAYKRNVKSVVFDGNITTIADGAFGECINLTSIEIPASVTTIGNTAFTGCGVLAKVTFAAGSKLTTLGNNVFMSCISLTSINIPASVTTLGYGVFSSCTNLKSVTFEPTTAPTIGENVFFDCPDDLKIYIPQDATGYTGNDASANWKALANKISQDILIDRDNEQITVPDGSTVIGNNGVEAEKVTLEGSTATFENVNTGATEIANGTNATLLLNGTNNLGDITIPTTGSLTLTAGGNAQVEVTSVKCDGNFTDQTGSVTSVSDGNGTPLLDITPPALSQEIPHNNSNLTLSIPATDGATTTLQKQKPDGSWEDAANTNRSFNLLSSRANSSRVTVTISATGTYRIVITKITDDGKTISLYTKPIKVTKESAPTPPPAPVYHTVTLPAVEGAVTDPVAGDHNVETWDNFRFTLTLTDDYNQSQPVVTTSRGEIITPRTSDGAYVVKYIRGDISISIDGIVKNPDPVANAAIEAGTRIDVRNGVILITVDRPTEAQVVTLSGQQVRSLHLPAGETRIAALAAGLYIVRLSNGTVQKVIVR